MPTAWYPRYPGDYLRDTGHLTLLEHGVYNVLLDTHYATRQPIPLERVYLLARAVSDDEKAAVDAVLKQFWRRTEDGWINDRAQAELAKQADRSAKARRSALSRSANAQRTLSERYSERGYTRARATTTTTGRIRDRSFPPSSPPRGGG